MMTCIEKEWRRAYLLLEMAPTDVTPMLLTALASYSSLGGKGGLMVVMVMVMMMMMMMVMVMMMVASIMTNYKVESCGHSECSKHFPLPFGIGAQAHHRTLNTKHCTQLHVGVSINFKTSFFSKVVFPKIELFISKIGKNG